MKIELQGLAKSIARQLLPASLRREIWDRLGARYFEKNSIRAIIAYAEAENRKPAPEVRRLIAQLQANGERANLSSIEAELGLEFKAFSYQDLIAYIFFNGKREGFFVDIGAFDGVEISNTYALERLGWDGICVEPMPEVFSLLSANRNCHLSNVAIATATESDVRFNKVTQSLGLSGVAGQMPDRIRRGLESRGLDIEQIAVNTSSFQDLMDRFPETRYIDFLSIDVEGGELEVLQSIDFQRFRFELITIENNTGTAVLQKYMRRNGYEVFMDLGVDLIFVPRKST